jgi:hypothetical protein
MTISSKLGRSASGGGTPRKPHLPHGVGRMASALKIGVDDGNPLVLNTPGRRKAFLRTSRDGGGSFGRMPMKVSAADLTPDDVHALMQAGALNDGGVHQRGTLRRSGREACIPEPPSSASPWAPLQARNAKRERPTSARPILPAHGATRWSLSRPLSSISTHLPAVQRQDLTRPDATSSDKDAQDLHSDADLGELSQTSLKTLWQESKISLETSSQYDLSQQWLLAVEHGARTAEPGGPKNLTRFLVRQKSREDVERRQRSLDITSTIEEPLRSPVSPRRPTEADPEHDEPVSRWQEFLHHLPFVQRLSAHHQVFSPLSRRRQSVTQFLCKHVSLPTWASNILYGLGLRCGAARNRS